MALMKKIISASRRTDIPRFHYEWLQTVLKNGEAEIANPRFREKIYKVDLRPETVHSIILWSKDFTHILKDPRHLDNYNLYFHYTINNYSKALEPYVPEYKETIRTLEGLLGKYHPRQFTIRFDPVIISYAGEQSLNDPDLGQDRLNVFKKLCVDLRALGMTECRVATSYIAMYPHVKRRMTKAGVAMGSYSKAQIIEFFKRIAEIAAQYNLTLYSCAAPLLEEVIGIRKGACIDANLLEDLFGGKLSKARDTGQRQSCGCHRSSDIGDYLKTCGFACVYCYANDTV